MPGVSKRDMRMRGREDGVWQGKQESGRFNRGNKGVKIGIFWGKELFSCRGNQGDVGLGLERSGINVPCLPSEYF